MRQRTQSARIVAYEHIAIRLVINSNNILQGLFYPDEPVSNLIEFARTNLICPQLNQSGFYLYTSPPRLVLSDVNKSLSSYDLIPAAYVYLGHRTVSPLNIQLASNISIGTLEQANQLVTQYVFNRTRSMNEDEKNASYNEKSTMETNTDNRPAKRNPPTNNVNDKDLRDKFRKFVPGKK